MNVSILKKAVFAAAMMSWSSLADTWTDPKTGITWTYTISDDGKASVGRVPSTITGAITIPSTLGGYSVTSIGLEAFYGCSGLTSVTIPSSVTIIGHFAFYNCSGLTNVAIPLNVTFIGDRAFYGCSGLTSVTIPSSVTSIGEWAFSHCSKLGSVDIGSSVSSIGGECFSYCRSLTNLVFRGNAPTTVGNGVFTETSLDLNIVVPVGSVGWNGDATSTTLPKRWPYNTESGRYIRHVGDEPISSSSTKVSTVQFVVTNIVVHYVFNSVQPEFAVPVSSDVGFVNIITEVKSGGAVSIPVTWALNYPTFSAKFGSDFTKALMKTTGKKNCAGNDMYVWQDYVAGTDPTNEKDVFTASITMVEGKPVISYTPELDDARKALRKYTVYGKVDLSDKDWIELSEADYGTNHFFKVTVEMK